MVTISCLVLATCLAAASALNLAKIQAYPPPQKGFRVDKYVGRYWYTQARYVACSWSGSASFTDVVYRMDPKGQSYVTSSSWRTGEDCTNAMSNTPMKSPGIFTQKDPIGDVYSGEWRVVATDYKKFAVSWGCTKPSLSGTCSDPWVACDTTHPHPDEHTVRIIEKVIEQLFGLTARELAPSTHDKPCVEPQHPHHAPPMSHHLKKTY